MSDNTKQDCPVCTRCIYFYLTYDYGKPYGCKAMGFKSRISPAKVVLGSSGMQCQSFVPKKIENDGSSKSRFYV